MKRKLINSAAALLLAVLPAAAQRAPAPKAAQKRAAQLKAAPAAPAAKAAPSKDTDWEAVAQHTIKIGTIEVYTPVTGISTAQDTYDVFAPFDGRVEELHSDLFSFVTPKSVLARMVSTEMAALLDSSSEESRKQTTRRWQDIYSFTEVKPDEQGVITNIYVEPQTRVTKGERLFTVAKKVVIIGRNTEPLYSPLATGMEARLVHARTSTPYDTELVNFLKIKGPGLTNRLWLEVTDLQAGIKIGEQFDGRLLVGRSTGAMLVPRSHLISANGTRFLITEVQTGLETEGETEILGHSSFYLEPPGAAEDKDGKDEKSR